MILASCSGSRSGTSLELAKQIFRNLPCLDEYQEIRSLARSLRRWEALRPELMALLEQKEDEDSELVVDIYLDEGEIDQALEAVNSRPLTWGYIDGMKLKVAKAAEETRPRAALEIYRQQTERFIAQRGRGNYQGACELLVKVRALYERLGESGTWAAYITALRQQKPSLPALKQELAAVGL